MDEDFVERAANLAAAEVQNGIERARMRSPTPPGFDGTCDCGQEIPIARVALGYHRCLECQVKHERQARHHR